MSGYCETASDTKDQTPARIVRSASTQAKTGRTMKTFPTAQPPSIRLPGADPNADSAGAASRTTPSAEMVPRKIVTAAPTLRVRTPSTISPSPAANPAIIFIQRPKRDTVPFETVPASTAPDDASTGLSMLRRAGVA